MLVTTVAEATSTKVCSGLCGGIRGTQGRKACDMINRKLHHFFPANKICQLKNHLFVFWYFVFAKNPEFTTCSAIILVKMLLLGQAVALKGCEVDSHRIITSGAFQSVRPGGGD